MNERPNEALIREILRTDARVHRAQSEARRAKVADPTDAAALAEAHDYIAGLLDGIADASTLPEVQGGARDAFRAATEILREASAEDPPAG
jgi:hypothetical protein